MKRVHLASLLVAAAFGTVVLLGSEAQAGWRHGSSGSWGSSGSSGSSGSWGSSGSSGSWGWSGGHGWRHGSHGSHGSSGGWSRSSGGWGSSGGWSNGSSGSSGSSGGWNGYHDQDAAPAEGKPATTPEGGTPPPPPVEGASTFYGPSGNSVSFTVDVPADAKVFVNGSATSSTGTTRTYISRGLQAGRTYGFSVRAEFAVDGQPVTQSKALRLTVGETGKLVFDTPAQAEPKVVAETPTKLTLHVPANAKVFLAGRETSSTGEVRDFTTKRLANGQNWDNYTIRVTVDRDGQPITQERTITLVSGEAHELSFDLQEEKVASAK